jgi:hypothetical protein
MHFIASSNQQMTRCERNITTRGCQGNLDTAMIVCYCTTDMCNQNLTTTLAVANTGAPPPVGSTPAGVPGKGVKELMVNLKSFRCSSSWFVFFGSRGVESNTRGT